MLRHFSFVSNTIIVLQVFMLIFGVVDLSALPEWILFGGKFHPLLLHLPVTMILLLIPLAFMANRDSQSQVLQSIFKYTLLYTTLFGTLAAIGGLLLASSGDYAQDTLTVHKWLGISLALLTQLLLYAREWIIAKKTTGQLALLSSAIIMIAGSHFGGSLTHGEDFLAWGTEKELATSFPVLTDSTTVFDGAIQPVVAAKCVTCHNNKKMKGGLDMSSFAAWQKGGKTGASWVSGSPDSSLLMARILLAMDDKKHMPPSGKAQLSANEILLFREWIRLGADNQLAFHALQHTDTLKQLIVQVASTGIPAKQAKQYSFSGASQSTIDGLNTPFRRILPLAYNSPALGVKFFLKEKFTPDMLDACSAIKEQVVEVNLSNMPADDKLLNTMGMFKNLEKLNLNGTSITGKTLGKLADCKHLEQLSLAGTAVDMNALQPLTAISSLKKVFLWNTKITDQDIVALKKQYPQISWDLGYVPDKNELLKLTPPYPANRDKRILEPGEPVTLKHPLPGVKIRYTLDGSNPDTTNGKVFEGPIPAKGLTRILSVATASGWISSNISDQTFFMKGIKVDSVNLLNPPDPKYRKFGSNALIDEIKGEAGNFGMNWLGFKDQTFKAAFHLNGTKAITQVLLSLADNTGSYIFPPTQIVVKAGNDRNQLKLIGKLSPEMPKSDRSNAVIPYLVDIIPGNYRYIEIEAVNIQKLPSWHRGKGEKGWVFVDEVFFY
jgi:uncharacterized membrane protein